jgi:hypothetical protein
MKARYFAYFARDLVEAACGLSSQSVKLLLHFLVVLLSDFSQLLFKKASMLGSQHLNL